MGEPARPPLAERAATRTLAKAIVDSVRNDEPMSEDVVNATLLQDDTNRFVFQLAQEIDLLFNDEMAFIAHAVMTATQTAVPDDARRQLMHEILQATRGRLPDWWPEFKAKELADG